jgi:hypothetical protein
MLFGDVTVLFGHGRKAGTIDVMTGVAPLGLKWVAFVGTTTARPSTATAAAIGTADFECRIMAPPLNACGLISRCEIAHHSSKTGHVS